jgi:hypothetical protein
LHSIYVDPPYTHPESFMVGMGYHPDVAAAELQRNVWSIGSHGGAVRPLVISACTLCTMRYVLIFRLPHSHFRILLPLSAFKPSLPPIFLKKYQYEQKSY